MALNYENRRRPAEGPRLYFVAACSTIAIGFVVAAIGATAMPHLLRGYDPSLIREGQWLMLFTPPFLLTYVVRAYLESRGEFLRSMFAQFLPNVFILIGLLILWLTHRLTPGSSALMYLLPFAVQTLWIAARLSRTMEIQPRRIPADLRVLFGYGIRCYGSDIVLALSTQLDLAVIVSFLSPVSLGLYTVALSLTRLSYMVLQPVVMVLFPYASGLDPNEAVELVARAARLSTMCSIAVGAILVLVAPLALPLVYGGAYGSALSIIPLLAAEASLSGLAWVLMQGFLATGRPATATYLQASWLIITIGLLVALVPRMSIVGAAVALLTSSIVRVVLVLFAYKGVVGRAPRLVPDATDFAYVRKKILQLTSRRAAILETG